MHHRNLVAQLERLLDIMRDEEDGFPYILLNAQQFVLHASTSNGVERAEGFIHQENCRIGR